MNMTSSFRHGWVHVSSADCLERVDGGGDLPKSKLQNPIFHFSFYNLFAGSSLHPTFLSPQLLVATTRSIPDALPSFHSSLILSTPPSISRSVRQSPEASAAGFCDSLLVRIACFPLCRFVWILSCRIFSVRRIPDSNPKASPFSVPWNPGCCRRFWCVVEGFRFEPSRPSLGLLPASLD